MTKDQLIDAITWAEVEAERAEENAKYFAKAPVDNEGRCAARAKEMREAAERFAILAEAASAHLRTL